MTKSDVMKEFLKKTVIPVVVALFLFSMFSRIFIENGAPDYFLIWLACGVPFGIGKMFTLIPIGKDIFFFFSHSIDDMNMKFLS